MLLNQRVDNPLGHVLLKGIGAAKTMIKRIEHGVWYTHDGREVCQDTAEGRREYARRRFIAAYLQNDMCGICGKPMRLEDMETDHIKPRGMGGARRDDRQENLQAVHTVCNGQKGSRRMPYVITQNS